MNEIRKIRLDYRWRNEKSRHSCLFYLKGHSQQCNEYDDLMVLITKTFKDLQEP